VLHLTRHGWAYNPLPFARAGLFDRAHAIIDDRPAVGANRTARLALARGEEALAAGRLPEAIRLLQNGIDLVRARRHLEFYESSLSLARAWRIAGQSSQALRVLEEAVRERPAYVTPGLAAAWWIKAQVHLARGYRQAGRRQDADALEKQVSFLLSQADADHPWLRQRDGDASDGSDEPGISLPGNDARRLRMGRAER
jgi:tetratricopeptide (TPR) repeat protein